LRAKRDGRADAHFAALVGFGLIFVAALARLARDARYRSFRIVRHAGTLGRGIGYCVEALAYLFLFCLYLVAPVGAALLFLFNIAASL
jgi:hypothetical protein